MLILNGSPSFVMGLAFRMKIGQIAYLQQIPADLITSAVCVRGWAACGSALASLTRIEVDHGDAASKAPDCPITTEGWTKRW